MGGDSYYYSQPEGNGGNGSNEKGCKDLIQILSEDIRKIPQLSDEKTKAIARKRCNAEKGTKKYHKLINQMVTGHLRFVVYLARDFTNDQLQRLIYFSEGVDGLIIAAKQYDPDRGVKFSTFSAYKIKDKILRAIEQGRAIRMPYTFLQAYHAIEKAKRKLEQKREGGTVFVDDITRITRYDSKTVNYAFRIMPGCRSLDYAIDNQYSVNGDEHSIKDILKDKTVAAPFDIASKNETKETIGSLLKKLPFRNREIVKLRFGLDNYGNMTLEEIGKIFKLTRERVRQIAENAISKFKNEENIKILEGCR